MVIYKQIVVTAKVYFSKLRLRSKFQIRVVSHMGVECPPWCFTIIFSASIWGVVTHQLPGSQGALNISYLHAHHIPYRKSWPSQKKKYLKYFIPWNHYIFAFKIKSKSLPPKKPAPPRSCRMGRCWGVGKFLEHCTNSLNGGSGGGINPHTNQILFVQLSTGLMLATFVSSSVTWFMDVRLRIWNDLKPPKFRSFGEWCSGGFAFQYFAMQILTEILKSEQVDYEKSI